MPDAPVALVVEAALAAALGPSPEVRLHVLARPARRRSGRGSGWRDLDPEATAAALSAAPRPAVVLVRPAAADPGAACLRPIARMLGLDVLTLPHGAGTAAWSVRLAARSRRGDLLRALQSLASALAADPEALPPLRPEVLARWAARAWRPCAWCLAGGALPGRACPRCGAAVAPAGAGPA